MHWLSEPALPPQRSANGVLRHSAFFPMATGAARWEGRQEDDSPSPDTGQHGLPAFCAGMFAQCRRVG